MLLKVPLFERALRRRGGGLDDDKGPGVQTPPNDESSASGEAEVDGREGEGIKGRDQ